MAGASGLDPVIARVLHYLTIGRRPNKAERREEINETLLLLRDWKRLSIKGGVLYRKKGIDPVSYQLVLPSTYHEKALYLLHDDMGHLGLERTLQFARERFYWPGMAKDIENYVKNCDRCLRRKATQPPYHKAPLVNISTTEPMELICMDYLSLEESKGGYSSVLVLTDHFTRYAQAFPTRNQTAQTTAKILFENFIVHYGFPARLHSDQGTLPEEKKADWKSYVAPLVHAYNCSQNDATGFSPYYLMFGRHPRLPVDLYLGVETTSSEARTCKDYANSLKEKLEHAYKLASEKAQGEGNSNARRYNKQLREMQLRPGDRVLVKKVAFQGKHKLADRGREVYRIVRRLGEDMPVYVVRPEGNSPRTKEPSTGIFCSLYSPFPDLG
ncbi:Retrovirus-related Pol polyprotein from transposon [Apostichopus japonicus]|uniref:Retrovirus-related Pol polyprotein from transposon n=1 Tax=Stichopus japonicus TaxID=307972 RepID=A0A2G8JW79_STIJA|nr:Retrovirus-related Pol polyprotein from transposon [Apostichopus japonicus]